MNERVDPLEISVDKLAEAIADEMYRSGVRLGLRSAGTSEELISLGRAAWENSPLTGHIPWTQRRFPSKAVPKLLEAGVASCEMRLDERGRWVFFFPFAK